MKTIDLKKRNHVVKKIVIIGPESTGKSTLSEALATELHTTWAAEYAREYLESIGRAYTEADLINIARGQLKNEELAITKAEQFAIIDTDLHVIRVWSEHKYGRCATDILNSIAERPCDLYLLTGIDIPWQDDPLREHPTREMRNYFYNIYRDTVIQSGTPWVAINGNENERLHTSLRAIQLLGERIC